MTASPEQPPANLISRLSSIAGTDDPSDVLFEVFVDWVTDRGIELYPAQEEAVLEILSGNHVILKTPTGSGKSLVAVAMHLWSFARGHRSYYTSPIKALVSEKFFDLCETFGPENVGMMTGDSTVNRDAAIVCCTAEILANIALREGAKADVHEVVMDEFHYYSDRERGVAWQVPLLTLPQATFLLMSATLGDTSDVEEGLTKLTGRDTAVVSSDQRPVPLDFSYREDVLTETIEKLVTGDKAPVYLVNFTQREAAENAQHLMSTNFSTKEEKKAIMAELADFRFDTPYGKEMQRYLKHGIGLHHGGLLPKYRLLVERLSRKGMLKVISGTDTLGVGVNVPIRTVLFSKLCKFDGAKWGILTVRDFKQIAGRAGRRGFDTQGYVCAQAPEHVIENKRLASKAALTGKKKFTRKQPPKKGYVPWSDDTFQQLQEREPEPLTSTFDITHGLLLNLLQRDDAHELKGGGYGVLVDLIGKSHATAGASRRLRRKARQQLKALLEAKLVTVEKKLGEPGSEIVVSDALQSDFSLMHTLSLWLVEALAVLDPASETYALDLVSFVESILENPKVVLYAQENLLKGDLVAQLKAEGVEYEERMEKLEQVSYPKPKAELIYELFNTFADARPWLAEQNIRPKSVLREMYEQYTTFNDYVRSLKIQKAEGVLLRYLSNGFKTLVQSVPDAFKTEEVHDVIAFYRTMLGRVDASLLQEWERMLNGGGDADDPADDLPPDITRDMKSFRARVRAEIHALVGALSRQDYEEAATLVAQPGPDDTFEAWPAASFEQALSGFYDEHERLVFNHRARLAEMTRLTKAEPWLFSLTQTLLDPEDARDWSIQVTIDLRDDHAPLGPLLRVDAIVG